MRTLYIPETFLWKPILKLKIYLNITTIIQLQEAAFSLRLKNTLAQTEMCVCPVLL